MSGPHLEAVLTGRAAVARMLDELTGLIERVLLWGVPVKPHSVRQGQRIFDVFLCDLHPRNVYLSEDALLPALDRWLGKYFAPHRRAETIAAPPRGSVV